MLPDNYRLKKRRDFSRIYARGRHDACSAFILYCLPRRGSTEVRIGFSASKKMCIRDSFFPAASFLLGENRLYWYYQRNTQGTPLFLGKSWGIALEKASFSVERLVDKLDTKNGRKLITFALLLSTVNLWISLFISSTSIFLANNH